ncbi:hypothetical protein PG995_014611 [Apiospora arundinis]
MSRIADYGERDAATAEYQSTGGESRSEEVMMTSDDVAKEDDDDLLAACNPRGEDDGIVDDLFDDCQPRSEKVVVTGEDVSESVIREG